MLSYKVNGKPYVSESSKSIQFLLQELKMTGKKIAIEKNGILILKSNYEHVNIEQGDCLEIITAVGGG